MPNLRFGGRLERVLSELSCDCGSCVLETGGEEGDGDESGAGTGSDTRSSWRVAAIFGTWIRFSNRWLERGPLLKDQR
jgi:hypothetical protein